MVYSHCMGLGQEMGQGLGSGNDKFLYAVLEMFTFVGDRHQDRDPLFPIVPVPFFVPPLVSVPCRVNKSLYLDA